MSNEVSAPNVIGYLDPDRLLTISQICIRYFGPNPNPHKPHPRYHSMRRMFKDYAKHTGVGKKNKHYGVPVRVVDRKLGGDS